MLVEHLLPVMADASEKVLPAVEDALSAVGAAPADLAGIGVSLGPGSYTGLRIGVATALGLARGLDVKAAGIPTLEALVAGAGLRGTVLAAVSARKGEVFAGGYLVGDGELRQLFEPAAYTASAVRAWAGEADGLQAVGSGRRQLPDLNVRWLPPLFDTPRPSAVAVLATDRPRRREPGGIEPLYLRGFGAPARDEVQGGA